MLHPFLNLLTSSHLISQMVSVLYMFIKQKSHFLTDEAHYITPLHSKCGIFIVIYLFLSLMILLIQAHHQ